MARLGSIGNDDYALDSQPSLPDRPMHESQGTALRPSPVDISFESEIVARSSGELYLYVNDAVFPPYDNHWLYRNNQGSAHVRVQLVTIPPSE